MSKLNPPLSVRLRSCQERKIRATSKKIGLSQQDTIRLAIEHGLPRLLDIIAPATEGKKQTAA